MSLHLNLSTGKFLNSSTLFKLSDALLLDVSSGEIVMSNLLVPRAGVDLFKLASLDLNFAQRKSLTDKVSGNNLITFSRASSGTYVDSDGLIKTAVTDTPRFDHDPVTGESLGLLIEEARTNLFLNSDTLSTQSVTSAATEYALSFYGTGTVTLSGNATGTLVGTGVNERVSLVVTATAGTITSTVTGTVEKGQIEAGSFPTSYIPTSGSTVTRSPDIATIEGTNFTGGWYNQSEGTIFTDISPLAAASGRGYLFSNGSDNQRLGQNTDSTTGFALFMSDGSTTSLSAAVSGMPKPIKACLAYKPGSSRGVIDRTLKTLSTTNDVPDAINQVGIGFQNYGGSSGFLNGHISRFAYFPTRKTDQELIDLTTDNRVYSYGQAITNYPHDLGALPSVVTRYIDLEKEYYANAAYDLN